MPAPPPACHAAMAISGPMPDGSPTVNASGAVASRICVLFQRSTGQSSVNVDHLSAAAEVASHFVRLGHTRMTVLTPGTATRAHALRLEGFEQAVRAAGLPPPVHVAAPGDNWLENGYNAALKNAGGM